MTLNDILATKGNAIFRIAPDATLAEAARTLVKHKVGSLLVFATDAAGEEQLAGIITERDLLYFCAEHEVPLASVQVSEVMTTELITGAPDDPVEKAMGLIVNRRIRHLPVLSEGQLLGIVSIGDIVKLQHDRLMMENRFMKDYIQR